MMIVYLSGSVVSHLARLVGWWPIPFAVPCRGYPIDGRQIMTSFGFDRKSFINNLNPPRGLTEDLGTVSQRRFNKRGISIYELFKVRDKFVIFENLFRANKN